MDGYIALHRQVLDNPVVCKDADHLAVWIYLLCEAVWRPTDVMFHGERITLLPGQLTTGRKVIARKFNISESKVQRILKSFEIEHQIEQRTDRQCRLITIVSWEKYQAIEQRNEQRVNNDRTTSEQRVNTKEEYKKENKGINKEKREYREKKFAPPTVAEVQEYISEKGYSIDAERFVDYYSANGWKVGRSPMKDWKATVRNWERRDREGNDGTNGFIHTGRADGKRGGMAAATGGSGSGAEDFDEVIPRVGVFFEEEARIKDDA